MRLEGPILPYLLNATRLASIYNTQRSAVKEPKRACGTLQGASILLRGCIKTATLYPLLWLVAKLDLQNSIVISIACLGAISLVRLAPPLPYLWPDALSRLGGSNYLNGSAPLLGLTADGQ
jgi:hypothetical protein